MARSECHIRTGCNISVTWDAAPRPRDHQASSCTRYRAVRALDLIRGERSQNLRKVHSPEITKWCLQQSTSFSGSAQNWQALWIKLESSFISHPIENVSPCPPGELIATVSRSGIFSRNCHLSSSLNVKNIFTPVSVPAWQHDVAIDQNVGVRGDWLWRHWDPRDILRQTSVLCWVGNVFSSVARNGEAGSDERPIILSLSRSASDLTCSGHVSSEDSGGKREVWG